MRMRSANRPPFAPECSTSNYACVPYIESSRRESAESTRVGEHQHQKSLLALAVAFMVTIANTHHMIWAVSLRRTSYKTYPFKIIVGI